MLMLYFNHQKAIPYQISKAFEPTCYGKFDRTEEEA
jgi:hypothetical protein